MGICPVDRFSFFCIFIEGFRVGLGVLAPEGFPFSHFPFSHACLLGEYFYLSNLTIIVFLLCFVTFGNIVIYFLFEVQ